MQGRPTRIERWSRDQRRQRDGPRRRGPGARRSSTAAVPVRVRARERYDALFHNHSHAVFSVNLRGCFTSVNQASERVSGYTAAELIGTEFVRLLPPHAVEPTLQIFVSLLDGGPRQLEVPFLHRNGSIVDLSLTAVPIVVQGEVRGVYGIAEDVSARNRLERELRQARSDAEEATRAKSLFLATISHEIRTPLTSVLAAAEMLGGTGLDDLQGHLVEIMSRQGTRLLDLIDDVLDFSRIEAGRSRLHRVDFRLRDVVDDTLRNLHPLAEAKGVTLCCAVDDDVPDLLHGDGTRLSQVLTNLAGNAVKFTEQGWVRLHVRRAPGEPNGESDGSALALHFSVADSGIGMDPSRVHRVFESFSQADPSIPQRYGGTGLGLAICREVVGMMGGSIDVESSPGAGSRFWFEVPLQLAAPLRGEAPAGIPLGVSAEEPAPLALEPAVPAQVPAAEPVEV